MPELRGGRKGLSSRRGWNYDIIIRICVRLPLTPRTDTHLMDNVAEREAREKSEQRREALRAAQRSDSNIYWFRRLKWGRPPLLSGAGAPGPGNGGFGIVELLLVIIIVASLGYVASTFLIR